MEGEGMKVTKAKAEAVLRSVEKAFLNAVTEQSRPTLIENWGDSGTWAVAWEDGPYEWCYQYNEMAAGYATKDPEFGFSRQPIKPIKGVYLEPYYSFVMCVYPE
jgi:hypothetical protein